MWIKDWWEIRSAMRHAIRAAARMHRSHEMWDRYVAEIGPTLSPEDLYLARYRAASTRHLEDLFSRAWLAMYKRDAETVVIMKDRLSHAIDQLRAVEDQHRGLRIHL